MKNFLWRIYFLLLIFSLIGAVGIIPYSSTLANSNVPDGMPKALMLVATFFQTFLITAVMGFFGLNLSLKTGLGVPVLQKFVYRGRGEILRAGYHIVFPVIIGIVCGLIMIVLDLLMIDIFHLETTGNIQAPVWWKGVFASFYGGLSEEIMMRLFAMNLIIFTLNKAGRKSEKKTSIGKVVIAMIISSIIFGIGHLAAAVSVGGGTPGFIVRTLILNFVPGMVFGWLYWKRSFLSAMIAHFTTDIIVHVIARIVLDSLTG